MLLMKGISLEELPCGALFAVLTSATLPERTMGSK
jgi:hypothetical protein